MTNMGGNHAPHILERHIMIHYINALIISLRILVAAVFASIAFGVGISIIKIFGGYVGWIAGLTVMTGAIVIAALPYITRVRLYESEEKEVMSGELVETLIEKAGK